MKSDEELKKAYKYYVGADGILNLEFLAWLDDLEDQDRIAELIDKEGDAIFAADTSRRYNILVDLSHIKKLFKPMLPKTKQRYIKMVSKKQVNKMALIGFNRFYRTLAYFITKLSGKLTRVGIFDSREKAVDWLKEK